MFTGAQGSAPSYSGSTLTLPSNTSYIVAEVWGGGGGGAGSSPSSGLNNGGGGGGGGGYSQTLYVSPLSSKYYYNIGKGGSGGVTGSPSVAGSGNSSYFGTGLATSTANGGDGGSSRDPGSGGDASGGSVNLSGSSGMNGKNNDGINSGSGGSGGSSPRGGGGGKSLGSSSGGYPGEAFGGGGGGGTGNNSSGNNGGAGGSGGLVITIYATSSPNAAGNDYAEMFPVSSPGITAGDIVAVDTGVPVSMKLASAAESAPLAGVIATNPGQLLGDKDAVGSRPVALAGRVPTKVNLEGGPIQIGDRIAPSSVPGVGKKASALDASVGIALEAFSGGADGFSQGSVTVFLDLQRGIDINAIALKLLGPNNPIFAASSNSGTASSTPSTGSTGSPQAGSQQADPLDFVGGMMSAIASRIDSLTTNGLTYSTDSTSTDASSTATTNTPYDRYVSDFLHSLFAQVAQWLANAANGIGDLYAKVIHSDKVQTGELCVQDVCVTRDQLAAVLATAPRSPAPASSSTSTATSSFPTTPPVISINGNNPAHINVGDTYADLGATITGPEADLNLGIKTFLNGALVSDIVLDTSQAATDTIDYVVTDQNGLTSTSTRTVIVEAAAAADPPPSTEETPPPTEPTPPAPDTTATTTTTSTTATTTEATSTAQ